MFQAAGRSSARQTTHMYVTFIRGRQDADFRGPVVSSGCLLGVRRCSMVPSGHAQLVLVLSLPYQSARTCVFPGHSSRNIYLHALPPRNDADRRRRPRPADSFTAWESTGPSHATPFLVRNLWQAVVTSGRPLSLCPEGQELEELPGISGWPSGLWIAARVMRVTSWPMSAR
jgi:hypothetical protein